MNLSNNNTLTCPACCLLCDDIVLPEARWNQASQFFSQAELANQALINGQPATLQAALEHAANIIKQAKQPVIAGLSTDINGMRAVIKLRNSIKANLQHINAASINAAMQVLQTQGWQSATLTEVKNRADTLVIVGSDLNQHNPRFFERFIWTEHALFTEPMRRNIVLLGDCGDTNNINQPEGCKLEHIACNNADLPAVMAALNALLLGKTLQATEIAGIKMTQLIDLATALQASKYAVFGWVTKEFSAHADLLISQIANAVNSLNLTTRAACLPLGGSDGDTSANNVLAWQTGETLKDVSNTKPDVQIWVNSFSPQAAPSFCHLPTIVLGNSHIAWREHANVFIPVATPGLDCAGTLFRVDSAVTLPLKAARKNELPTLSQIIEQIEVLLTWLRSLKIAK